MYKDQDERRFKTNARSKSSTLYKVLLRNRLLLCKNECRTENTPPGRTSYLLHTYLLVQCLRYA